MPTFSFSGSHKHSHKSVSGQVDASDEMAARNKLSLRSIEVDVLNLLETVALPAIEAPPIRPLRRAPLNLTPLALAMMGLGVLWQFASSRIAQAQLAAAPVQRVHLKVEARLQPLPADLDTSKLEVSLHYPEYPLDLSRRGQDLAIDQQGRFCIEQDVQLRQKPRLVRVSCRAPGWRSVEFANLPVDEQTSSCQIPPIAMQRAVP